MQKEELLKAGPAQQLAQAQGFTSTGSVRASRAGPQQAQNSAPGYATFSGNTNGSRNKFVHQQQQ